MSIDISLEQVSHWSNEKTIWTTVTNYGYRLYTLNMLKSLSPFSLDRNVLILCVDKASADWFTKKGYRVFALHHHYERFCAWNTHEYDQICYLKLEWIYRILSLGKNILLIDGDIVFQKSPEDDVRRWESNIQIDGRIQNDDQDDQSTYNLCTGYLFIRSSPQMIRLYDCVSEEGKQKYQTCVFDNNDQSYFNKYVKPYSQFQPLPLDQYPNGKYFFRHIDRIRSTTIMVHFNWIKGHAKMSTMKDYKMWLLSKEEEI
jgi:hypothetical protein